MWNPLRLIRRRRMLAACRRLSAEEGRFVEAFREVASQTGKPRGLLWKSVVAAEPPRFVIDGAGILRGLVAIEVEFDAADDGEMDDAPGLAMVRSAIATFYWNGSTWIAEPRAVFNLGPDELIARQPGWEPFAIP